MTREEVIHALAICLPEIEDDCEKSCKDCPYWVCGDTVALPIRLIEDIRALLKGQETVEPKMMEFVDKGLTWEKYEVPTCGVCGAMLGDALFCPMCGREVKWE